MADADAIIAKYPTGAVVDVFHHPEDPGIVCLERGDPPVSDILMHHFAPLFFGGMLVMIGIMVVVLRQ